MLLSWSTAVVVDGGSPSFFVSVWLPLSISVFASSISDNGGAAGYSGATGVFLEQWCMTCGHSRYKPRTGMGKTLVAYKKLRYFQSHLDCRGYSCHQELQST